MTVDCPACAAALPEGARFCVMCGTRLALCPSCGTPAAPEQRFCGSCGSQLAAVVSPVRERRQVSVLFCDLVGFTRFSERRDHEEVRPVLEEYFAVARSAVTTHRGRIEKFIGDAVMAVWGTSIAREDDAERAVRTALAITKAVAQLADRLAIPELQVRVGVLAGEATVDAGMVIGDAVNTASRIQSLAAPGTVLVDETTRRMCDEAFGFRDAGAHPVKGKAEPVQTWQVIGAGRGGRSEDVVDGALVEPPFIGREAIVATVRGALQRLVSGALPAAIVTAIGAAGLGKSRLAHELEQMVAALPRPVVCHRGRAVSYGEGGGFHALAEIVRAAAGATAEDTTDDLAFAVEALLVRVVGDLSERDRIRLAAHRLLDLDDGTATLERGELFSAWRSLLVRLADEQPVVLVFDDLQFAGQEQLDFIAHLREWAGAAAILILAESRPDARVEALAALGDRVELAPLSDPQIEQLVAGTVREAPPALVAAIRADGAGIPLYAIETLRALADQGILVVRDGRYVVHGELLEVPPTIRALVASRLDTLSGEERRALVVCAVLGERFAASSMSAVAALGPAPVVDILRRLMTRALIVSAGLDEYEFVQGVVRRVALATLSRRERRRLHLAAADHLATSGLDIEPTVIAGHLVAALESGTGGEADVIVLRRRTRSALVAAAERAFSVTLTAESLQHFDRAVELADDDEAAVALIERAAYVAMRGSLHDDAADRWGAAAARHGQAGRERPRLAAMTQRVRAERHLRPAAERRRDLEAIDAALAGIDDGPAGHAACALAYVQYVVGDHAASLRTGRRAEQIASACADDGLRAMALSAQATALAELGQLEEAIVTYDRAVPLVAAYDPAWLPDFLGLRAATLASLGRFAEAAEGARETTALARRHGVRL